MTERQLYDTNLAMGLGLIDETKVLLHAWEHNMSAAELYEKILGSGALSQISAYRLRNIVVRAFGNRYLIDESRPAKNLKLLLPHLSANQVEQLFYLYTCRANPILADFVREVYWPTYEAGAQYVPKATAETFIQRAIDDNKTPSRWAAGQVLRLGRYLTGCLTDFGMLGAPSKNGRPLRLVNMDPTALTYIAHELHFSGIPDNALLAHEDWRLFGLTRDDVLAEVKRLALKGFVVVQAVGDATRISWKHSDMEALCDVLAQS